MPWIKELCEDMICGSAVGIVKGEKAALDQFASKASPEMVAVDVVTAAELVCTKSFKFRFAFVLTGACLNIVGC